MLFRSPTGKTGMAVHTTSMVTDLMMSLQQSPSFPEVEAVVVMRAIASPSVRATAWLVMQSPMLCLVEWITGG